MRPVPFLDLTRMGALEFHEPAWDDFPCLRLAYRALEADRSLPIVLNAANEVAVAAFLEGRLAFTDIPELIARTMDAHVPSPAATLDRGPPHRCLGPGTGRSRDAGVTIADRRGIRVTTLLAFAFVLGVLVFVHELGHFMAARWNGVRVLTFSLGFGPKLLKFRRGDTEYCLSAIPLGGYVKMAGENPEDPRSGQPDEFLSKTKWQRFQILIMGPAMNLVLAVIVLAVVLMQGATAPAYISRPALVGVVQAGSPAERAGLQPRRHHHAARFRGRRDLGTAGDGRGLAPRARSRDGGHPRSASEQRLTIRPDPTELRTRGNARFEIGTIGVLPDVNPSIRALVAGEPAEKAGLKPGDVIVSINGAADGVRLAGIGGDLQAPRAGNPDGRAAERRRADDRRRRPRGRATTAASASTSATKWSRSHPRRCRPSA